MVQKAGTGVPGIKRLFIHWIKLAALIRMHIDLYVVGGSAIKML